jgi:hypothetical protein
MVLHRVVVRIGVFPCTGLVLVVFTFLSVSMPPHADRPSETLLQEQTVAAMKFLVNVGT